MKPPILRIAIAIFFLISSNYIFANFHLTSWSSLKLEQESEDEKSAKKEKENSQINNEAVSFLNELIKRLDVNKDADKIEALNAMRDYIEKNLKNDPGTVLHKGACKARDTADRKDNQKAIRAYVDKISSATAKKVFKLVLLAKGTGRTTGHIAELTITNNSDQYITLHPELVYIPGTNRYQSYVGYIPEGITIAPGQTKMVPIDGYCANPHVPPVSSGENMPTPEEWIPIDETPTDGFILVGDPPAAPEPMNPPGPTRSPHHTTTIYISDLPTIPSFDPGMITTMMDSPGFTEEEEEENPEIQVTWPGTLEEIPGTFNPADDPEVFAQITVDGILNIIEIVDTIQNSGLYVTPFSNDKEKEKEAIIQQTFWIFVAGLVGDEYKEENFARNVYQQFETATGKSVTALPPEQKEQIDNGVSDFWTVYTAVGLEAKIISVEKSPNVPISNPENNSETEESDCCESMSSQYYNPKLDFDMKIADQWSDEAERRKIIQEAKKAMEQGIDPKVDQAMGEYDVSKNPTSATSFWKPGVVGGFASAYAKTWFQNSNKRWEWVWGTERLDTDAGGKMSKTLKYETGEDCRAIVAGTSLVRIRASSSAFDAVAGNRHNENTEDQLAFLKSVKYGAKLSLEWLILRGRGKTNKSFKNFVKDDLTDNIKGEVTEQLENEVQKLADEYLGEYLKALGLKTEDLNMDKLQLPDLEESLEKLLGIDIPTLDDLENFISDGIEASLNLFFVSNTSASADGFLKVNVGKNVGTVRALTKIHYGREAQESTKEAMTWSGPDCQEKIISDVQPNALTISTEGYVNMTSEAESEYGFGNGSAKAYLESMNLQMLVGLCIYEEEDTTKFSIEAIGSLDWYGSSDKEQENLKKALGPLEKQILDGLSKEVSNFQKKNGNTSLENYTGEMLKNALDQKIRKWAAENTFYWKDCSD